MEKLLEKMMEQMTQQFAKIDQRFEQIDKRFDEMEKRFDHLESTVKSLEETIKNNATECRSILNIETRLDQHEAIFKTVTDEIKGMKIDIDYLSKKGGILEKEINQIKMRMQI